MDVKKAGAHLKFIREKKGLTYQRVYDYTKIQPEVLKDIEEGSSKISDAFLKGFIKTYANFLSVDLKPFYKIEQTTQNKKTTEAKKEISRIPKLNNKFYIGLVLVSATIFGFFLLKVKSPNTEKVLIETPPKTSNENTDINPEPQERTFLEKIESFEFHEEVFIQADNKIKFYFKVDDQNLETRTLEANSSYSINGINKIYIRVKDPTKQTRIFYNGRSLDFKTSIFEKSFTSDAL